MDKVRKLRLMKEHKCIHCEDPLPPEYSLDSCQRCKRILKRAAADGGWRFKLFVEILDHYGWRCNCCGEREPFFLSVDHVHGGGNEHREEARKEVNEWYKVVVAEGFPDTYQVLCFNCNLGKNRFGGTCPHEKSI